MKNIFITLIFLISSNNIFCQEVFYLHAVKIDDDNIENFENIQREYVSALAQDAKKDGIIKDWVLLKPIENVGEITEQEYNYVWVHIFENVEQMTNRTNWWLKSKENLVSTPQYFIKVNSRKVVISTGKLKNKLYPHLMQSTL